MYSFACDYLEGCHEDVLKALCETNMEQAPGYGADRFTKQAADAIRSACQDEQASVYFVNGGTQTNQLVIDTMLAPYEGVIAAQTGHINVHEAGAIECTGHKVLALPETNGKLSASDVDAYVQRFYRDDNHEHMVFPGMVYVSHPTEYGTLYSADELRQLAKVCHAHHLKLFLDGARLGYGLAADDTDVTLPLIDELCDVFYIGGTKVGALNGEAIVFPGGKEPTHFLTQIKQHGALFAKGRLVGVQFLALFTDDLYLRISRHAIEAAKQIRQIFEAAGCQFYIDSPTNQQFIILENNVMKELSRWVEFGYWEDYDEDHTVVRFASSWATTQEGIEELRQAVSRCLKQPSMKLVQGEEKDLSAAMDMINAAKRYLHDCGVDQWQTGYPDEACILEDLRSKKGYFAQVGDQKIGYLCIDFNGEPAYEHLNGSWHTDLPYVVVHRMAFSDQTRGHGFSHKLFQLIEELSASKGIYSFRVDTDADNQKMKHILSQNGFQYCGTIWFDHSEKIAFDKKIGSETNENM